MELQEKIDIMKAAAQEHLLSQRREDGMWEGHLSSSAISTSVSIFALSLIDATRYRSAIQQGAEWLLRTSVDGTWGDSVESPPNMTATLLTYTALHHLGRVPQTTRHHLTDVLGWHNEEELIRGVLDYYGKDLTFSVPILMMCALAGVIHDWKKIPPFPFELALLPQSTFRFLQLPVVSYAIPALIAVGILQNRKRRTWFTPLRQRFEGKAMQVLTTLQPADGGFLEAAPLTAFVSMCLAEAQYVSHSVTQACAQFLAATQREDGAWPIDTNLAAWVTSLSARALGGDLPDRQALADTIRRNATTRKHPFTGAPAGGWGWTNLSGSVPDGDDTSGALVALYTLLDGHYVAEVGQGIRWLIALQNRDGGMPTFCKGWGRLPFDRSTPDITAHALLAMSLWCDHLPKDMQPSTRRSMNRMLAWLEHTQTDGGSWYPLWFGDQDAADEHNPVYGAATLMDYLHSSGMPRAERLASRTVPFLLDSQDRFGGWGGTGGIPSKVTLTAKAIGALAPYRQQKAVEQAIRKGVDYLYTHYENGTLYRLEPIGLYFSRLWYSEELYNPIFLLTALKRL